jgi:hypothetical protein
MLDQYQTGAMVTLAFLLAVMAAAVVGAFLALAWGHPGGWVITVFAIYSLKLLRDLFRQKEVQ